MFMKYEYDLKKIFFARSKVSFMKKSMNKALVTPTPVPIH